MLRDLGYLVTVVALTGLVVFGMLTISSRDAEQPVKVVKVICYVQTEHPLSVVCPDAGYWHPLGPTTRTAVVPSR